MFATFTTPVQHRQPFERGRIVCLREAGSTYRRVAEHVGHNVSGGGRYFQQWSVEHSHTLDQVLDGHVVQTHVRIDALC